MAPQGPGVTSPGYTAMELEDPADDIVADVGSTRAIFNKGPVRDIVLSHFEVDIS